MRGILADRDVQGQVNVLVTILESEAWRDLWSALHLTVRTFPDLGLALNAPDALIWRVCQQEQVVLLTANRNADGPDSLEVTLRRGIAPDSLPVFTLADPQRVLQSRDYAERVAASLLDYLLNIDRIRGAGRMYLP